MKNRLLLLLLMATACPVFSARSQNVVPADMERLRVAYEAARARANRPIDEKYLAELGKLQDTYTKAAKLNEALAIATEIKTVKERMGLPPAASAPAMAVAPTPAAVKPPATTDGREATVAILANTPDGYRLGGVKRGDTITLEYVSGKWKSKGGIATENPDDPKAAYGEDDRLVIAEAASPEGVPGKVIKVVPPETSLKPFTYLMQTSRDDVVLRIHSNSDRKENPGSVTYKLKLVR